MNLSEFGNKCRLIFFRYRKSRKNLLLVEPKRNQVQVQSVPLPLPLPSPSSPLPLPLFPSPSSHEKSALEERGFPVGGGGVEVRVKGSWQRKMVFLHLNPIPQLLPNHRRTCFIWAIYSSLLIQFLMKIKT